MIPENVKALMNIIIEHGYEVYIVGGYVRDKLLDRDNNDIDLCTNMPLEELKEFYELKMMKRNERRNTGIIKFDDEVVEISSFKGNNLREDVLRRDFTINALAMNVDGEVIDYVGGVKDLQDGVIRLVNNDGRLLSIDPLRMLRAVRFSGVLGFEIESNTLKNINSNKHLITTVAQERVLVEIFKILSTERPGDVISKYREIIVEAIPELKPMLDCPQNHPYHMYDVFDHSMAVLNSTKNDPVLRMAALFHDAGKPAVKTTDEKGIDHFFGHANRSDILFRKFCERVKAGKKFTESVGNLIKYHDNMLSVKPGGIKKFTDKIGEKNLDLYFDLRIADILGQNHDTENRINEIEKLRTLYKENSEIVNVSKKQLKIRGCTLVKMGYPSILIPTIRKDLIEKVSSGELENSEEKLLNYVSNKYR